MYLKTLAFLVLIGSTAPTWFAQSGPGVGILLPESEPAAVWVSSSPCGLNLAIGALGFARMLALECSLQVFHLFVYFLAALLRVEEDVVRVAVLAVPFVVQALETCCVFLLQVLQALHQFIVGLSAGVFHGDAVGVEKVLPKQAKMFQPLEAQKCGLETAIQGLQGLVGV